MDPDTKPVHSAPRQLLSVLDGIVLMCGMVIGVGIFKAPSIVAGNTSSEAAFFGAWLPGGLAVMAAGIPLYFWARRRQD